MRQLLTSLVLIALYTAAASAQPYAYIANSNSGTVTVIDLSTNDKIATVDVGVDPAGVAASPKGDVVYVANQGASSGTGSVSIIEVSTNTVKHTVDVGIFKLTEKGAEAPLDVFKF